MARLYADENFPLPVVTELRRLGHDVVTLQESGLARQAIPDEAVLSLASAERRAVVTLNRKHFIQLHPRFPTMPASLCTPSIPTSPARPNACTPPWPRRESCPTH